MSRFGSSEEAPKEQSSGKKKPVTQARVKNIDISLWDNEKGMTISINKSYKVGEEWKNMRMTLFPSEIGSLDDALAEFAKKPEVVKLFKSGDSASPEPNTDSSAEKSPEKDNDTIVLELIAEHKEQIGETASEGCAYERLKEVFTGEIRDLDESLNKMLDEGTIFEPVFGYLKKVSEKTSASIEQGSKLFDNLPTDIQNNLQNNSNRFSITAMAEGLMLSLDLTIDEATAISTFVKELERKREEG